MTLVSMAHVADYKGDLDPSDPGALADHNTNPDQICFGCWCYSCGGRTDEPRIERDDDPHAGDPNHRWCFE